MISQDEVEALCTHISGLEAKIAELENHVDHLMRERTLLIEGKRALEAVGRARIGYQPLPSSNDR